VTLSGKSNSLNLLYRASLEAKVKTNPEAEALNLLVHEYSATKEQKFEVLFTLGHLFSKHDFEQTFE
jgi:hypothetical protein